MTAFSSVLLVVLLTHFNPSLLSYHIALPEFLERWFDLTVWAGILLVTAYAMGSLYERNRRHMQELRESYNGILMILQQFAANDKYSGDHAYRVAVCATRIAECMSLDSERIEDVRAAALLHNVEKLGISTDMLCKAAQMTEVEAGEDKKRDKAMGGSLRRVVPILLAYQRQRSGDESERVTAPLEVRILTVADAYEDLTGEQSGEKLSPAQAEEAIIRGSGSEYDSRVVDAFIKAFQFRVMKKGTGV